jgi:hypothetical protein
MPSWKVKATDSTSTATIRRRRLPAAQVIMVRMVGALFACCCVAAGCAGPIADGAPTGGACLQLTVAGRWVHYYQGGREVSAARFTEALVAVESARRAAERSRASERAAWIALGTGVGVFLIGTSGAIASYVRHDSRFTDEEAAWLSVEGAGVTTGVVGVAVGMTLSRRRLAEAVGLHNRETRCVP